VSTHPFEKEFDRVIVAFRRSQAEADHKFLDAAGASVKAAIRFYGEAVARETRALDALRRARSFLDRVGDEYPTRLAAVLAATDELRSLVLSEAERGRNGDDFDAAVDRAELQGLAAAVRSLESLSRHESITAGCD
jgi:signal transduction histidine kinase